MKNTIIQQKPDLKTNNTTSYHNKTEICINTQDIDFINIDSPHITWDNIAKQVLEEYVNLWKNIAGGVNEM